MRITQDWETPLAEISGAAEALEFIGEGQAEPSMQAALWLLARVLRASADGLEKIIHGHNTAELQKETRQEGRTH